MPLKDFSPEGLLPAPTQRNWESYMCEFRKFLRNRECLSPLERLKSKSLSTRAICGCVYQ